MSESALRDGVRWGGDAVHMDRFYKIESAAIVPSWLGADGSSQTTERRLLTLSGHQGPNVSLVLKSSSGLK